MKLSKLTTAILQNFSMINNSIFIDEQFRLKTKTPNASNIIAIATIEEDLPKLAIYALDELLASMSLFDQNKIDFEFTDQFIKMKQELMQINYRLSDDIHILTKCKPSADYAKFDKFDATLKLTDVELGNIQKAAKILKANAVSFNLKDGKGLIRLTNTLVPMDNSFELDIVGKGDCEATLFVENLLIMDSNYTVNVATDSVVKFTSDNLPLMYFIACAEL